MKNAGRTKSWIAGKPEITTLQRVPEILAQQQTTSP